MNSVASGEKKTEGASPFAIPTAHSALDSALRAKGLAGRAKATFAEHPEIKSVCDNLARYLLRIVPTEDQKDVLLDRCIEAGFKELQLNPGQDAVLAFCRGALAPAHEMLYWAIFINKRFDGAICWDCVSMPLLDWITVHLKEPQVAFRSELQHTIIEAPAFREILAFKVIPASAILRLNSRFGEIINDPSAVN